jgi:hypothetical protein
MRCEFRRPELIPSLPHAMMQTFPKTEIIDSLSKFLPSPLLMTTPSGSSSSLSLIPKPRGEVTRIGRGGYTLKRVLEEEHEWKDGLYDEIRV